MSEGIDLKYILRVLRRRFYLFFIPAALLIAVGTAIVMSLPAIYSADAKILVASQQIPDNLVKSTVTELASERLQVIQQRVLTRDNLLSLVDKFTLFSKRSDLSRTDIVDLMRSRITFEPIDFQLAATKRKDDRLTAAFAVQFDYEDPALAEKVTNELVTYIINEDVKSRSGRASDTTKFLEREAQRLSTELSQVQGQVSEFKLQNTETLPEKLAFNMSLLERTERNIADTQKEIATNDEQQRLIKLEASFKASADSGVPLEGDKSIAKKLADAKLEYDIRKTQLAPTHPEMRMLKDAIAVLEKQAQSDPGEPIKAATPTFAQDANAQLYQAKLDSLAQAHKISEDQLLKFQTDGEKLRSVIVKTPEVGATLAVLERKQSALQKDFDEMADKYAQARLGERLEQDQQAERFEVIEQPVQPQVPSKPKRVPLLVGVVAAALAVGGALAGGVEFLDGTIRRSADIVNQLKQRPIVIIPYIRTKTEIRRRRYRIFLRLLFWLAFIAAILLAINFFYKPIDELFYRALVLLKLRQPA